MPELSPKAFHKLLDFLDADPERAGQRYEDLRRRLEIFYEGRSCGYASEVLSDKTLDVIAAKLLEGLELGSYTDLLRYCLGVARNVLKDHLKQHKTTALTVDPPAPLEDDASSEPRLRCLERCLEKLAPESRKLILDFYAGERRAKIENRQRLADDLAITPNALRRRTHTIRARLETCIGECMGRGEGG